MQSWMDIASRLKDWLQSHLASASVPVPVLMVSGSQGIGKSTALEQLQADAELNIAVLGLDDFYLPRSDRMELAKSVHPLFETRGPPGTHDIGLLIQTIEALKAAKPGAQTIWPSFDKSKDERKPRSDWHSFVGPPDVILVEGWLIGVLPDPAAPQSPPMNAIEMQDLEGVWRAHQEAALSKAYAALWNLADDFFHLLAPSFESVCGWRTQQEEGNLGLSPGTLPEDRKIWVQEFVLHYERITRRVLSGSRRAGKSLHVDDARSPIAHTPVIPYLVFTDLDGTLLDHHTYDYRPALPALDRIKRAGGHVVLASSKTAAEIIVLREALGLSHCPAIVENGAGLLPPSYGKTPDGPGEAKEHDALIEVLGALPASLRQHFEGFSDWTVDEIAERTGLDIESAYLAARRQFSEPGVWTGSEETLAAFVQELSKLGITARKGGRFLTLSLGKTKADQMDAIIEDYSGTAAQPLTIALGDAPNDAEMIARAQRGVILNNANGNQIAKLPGELDGTIVRWPDGGPAAWNAAVLDWLDSLNEADMDKSEHQS